MADGALIAARFALMIGLALLMGLPLFWWVMGMPGRRGLIALLSVAVALLSAFWLLASAAAMTGGPIVPPDWATAWILLTMTPIGVGLAVRGAALLLTLLAAGLPRGERWALAPAAIAAATLAWTGHAGATEDPFGMVHRMADIAHIWAAAGWLGALAVLVHATVTLRDGTADGLRLAAMLSRFGWMGTLIVATLLASGLINLVMIVGLAQTPALLATRYGWLLGAKLTLFAAMLALAAGNRWWLTPALEQGGSRQAIMRLRVSLVAETGAAVAIIALVAWLGTLDPMG